MSGGAPTPYIPNTDADRALMLERIGVSSADDLFADIPEQFRDPAIAHLPRHLDEATLVNTFKEYAGNGHEGLPSFLGAGAYRRFIPATTGHIVSRNEFVTAYTPYQPEISQGTLQTAFEYQEVVCELTGLDVSNTGLYDVGSATGEACLLAARVTKRKAIAACEPIHPGTLDVIRTYAYAGDLQVDVISNPSDVRAEHACLVTQQPDYLGTIRDIEECSAAATEAGALLVVVADPFALGLLRAPGDAGADVVTADGRDMAFPMTFGGPSLGLFAAKMEYLRQMPGRIVGRTKELHGRNGEPPRTGYVLTLQAREQFIRRERATSNFSTGQQLLALAFTATMHALGPRGLRSAAEACYQSAHEVARRINAIEGYRVVERGPWFQEFLVRGPVSAAELHRRLADQFIEPGLDVSTRPEPEARDALLFCVTETTSEAAIELLLLALDQIAENGR